MNSRYRIAGDHFLIVKYGERLSLRVNFKVIILCDLLRKRQIRGIRGISSSINSMMVDYDPFRISIDDLILEIQGLEDREGPDLRTLPSRLIRIPVVYGDPWTRACAEEFHASPNLEFVAAYNRMSPEELVKWHLACVFWVLYIGFTPGLPSFVPMNSVKGVSAPKYRVPRTLTPRGTLGIGGILQCLYPLSSPGGYQMLGRTPLAIYDLKQRNRVFEDDIVLFRPGDRIVFEAISHKEFLAIERNLATYRYQIVEEEWSLSRFAREEKNPDV